MLPSYVVTKRLCICQLSFQLKFLFCIINYPTSSHQKWLSETGEKKDGEKLEKDKEVEEEEDEEDEFVQNVFVHIYDEEGRYYTDLTTFHGMVRRFLLFLMKEKRFSLQQ